MIEVLRSSQHGADGNGSRNHKSKPKQKGKRDVDQLSHVDYVTTDANSSHGESQFFIFPISRGVYWSVTVVISAVSIRVNADRLCVLCSGGGISSESRVNLGTHAHLTCATTRSSHFSWRYFGCHSGGVCRHESGSVRLVLDVLCSGGSCTSMAYG